MKTQTREELEEWAESRGNDDAVSLYPHRDTDFFRLRLRGQIIAREELSVYGRAAKRYAEGYAHAYINEIDCLDRDGCLEYYGLTPEDVA